jgi:hypothetical protein
VLPLSSLPEPRPATLVCLSYSAQDLLDARDRPSSTACSGLMPSTATRWIALAQGTPAKPGRVASCLTPQSSCNAAGAS